MLVQPQTTENTTVQALAQLFGILADPTRLRILSVLQESELPVGKIANQVGMSVSAISHQLRLLKTMKLVKYRKQGKNVYYSLDDSHIEQLIALAREHVEE
jgi:DNA-binding transcriptional ArsR family regulator